VTTENVVSPKLSSKRLLQPDPWVLFGLIGGFFLAILGLLASLLAIAEFPWGELGQTDAVDVTVEKVVTQKGGDVIGFRNRDKRGFSCHVRICGYPDWERDIGKRATIWILSGEVAQIRVDGNIRKSFDDIRATVRPRLYLFPGFVAAGILVMIISYFGLRSGRQTKL